MKSEFAVIKDLWDADTGEGRDEEMVRQLSDEYVAANPEEFTSFDGLDEKQLVKALDTFRLAGLEDDEWRVQVWLWYSFLPQEIGGTYKATVRAH